MTASRLALVSAIGAACLTASGIGGYLAVRSASPGASAAPAGPAIASSPAVTNATTLEPPAATAVHAALTSARPAAPTPAPAGDRRPRTEEVRPSAPAAATPAPTPDITPVDELAEAPPPPAPAAASVDGTGLGAMWLPEARLDPVLRELTISEGSVIGIRLDTEVSSEQSEVEDRVVAYVTRNVVVDDEVVIPEGARLEGTVTEVDRGGRFRDRARVGIVFSSLIVDNVRLPLDTEPIYREGEGPAGEATSKIGASAVVGTILGAMIGGKKGAAIGGTAGAAGGTAVVMTGDRNAAVISAGSALTIRLAAPLAVTVR